ncbi:MAG: helix-turn-helix transcriptional regulator [Pseudomonadota bacterium]
MSRDDSFHDLVGKIYELGVEADHWPEMLGEIAAFFGSDRASYNSKDLNDRWRFVDILIHPEPDSPKVRKAMAVFGELTPGDDIYWVRGRQPQHLAKPILIGNQIVRISELERSLLYNEMLRHAGLFDNLIMPMVQGSDSVSFLNIYRPQPNNPFTEEDGLFYARLKPHLMNVVRLQTKFQHVLQLGGLASGVLDTLSFGVALVDAKGVIEFVNKKAQQELSRRSVLCERSNRLKLLSDDAHAKFTIALSRACGLNAGEKAKGKKALLVGGGVSAPSIDASRCLQVLVYPFEPRTHGSFAKLVTSKRLALVAIVDPHHNKNADSETLRLLYGLTPKEAEIAVLIAAGQNTNQIAASLRNSVGTVRWHINNIFSKTGVSRQADLGRLVQTITPLTD